MHGNLVKNCCREKGEKKFIDRFFSSLHSSGLASCHVSGYKPHSIFPAFISISITEPTIKRSFLGKCDSVHLRTILNAREREKEFFFCCGVRVAMRDGPSIDSVFSLSRSLCHLPEKKILSSLWLSLLFP